MAWPPPSYTGETASNACGFKGDRKQHKSSVWTCCTTYIHTHDEIEAHGYGMIYKLTIVSIHVAKV